MADGATVDGSSTAVDSMWASGEARGLNGFPTAGDPVARDMDVFVDKGEPGTGVSGAVEHAGVVSVADDDGTSAGSGDSSFAGSSFTSSLRGTWTSCGESTATRCNDFNLIFGEAGGLGSCKAFCTTCSGGFARGEMMTPGASDGLPLRDQITHPEMDISDAFGRLAGVDGTEDASEVVADADKCSWNVGSAWEEECT